MRSKTNRGLCILLFAVLLLALTACGGERVQSAPTAQPGPTAAPSAAPTPEPTAEPAEKSLADSLEKGVEQNGDIIILYTGDVHCGIDQGFGYAGLQQVRDSLRAMGYDVILADTGDSVQGEAIGTATRGEAIIELMNQIGYDIAVPGNHEFDYGMEQFFTLTQMAEFPYVCCNFNYKGDLVFEPYVIRELAGKKVAFIGLATPHTPTVTTPKYFKDENGQFVYGFLREGNGETFYAAVQSAADAARAEGADYVIVLGHIGGEATCTPTATISACWKSAGSRSWMPWSGASGTYPGSWAPSPRSPG